MTGFIVAAVIMVVVGLVWILPPLLRGGARQRIDRAAVNLGILKDQLADLEADRVRGAIGEEQYAATKADLQQRVLEETQTDSGTEVLKPSWRGRVTAAVVVVVLPIAAGLTYLRSGDLGAFDPLMRQGVDAAHRMGNEDMEQAARRLAERLQKEPDNANGWSTLARTYYSMGRFAEASAAFEKLVELIPDDASLLADYADALAMTQGRRIAGKPRELVDRALRIDPLQWKALAMAGTDAFERQEYKEAVALWEKLYESLPAEAQMKQQLAGSINEARQRGGMPPMAAVAAAPAAPAAPMAAPAAPAVAKAPAKAAVAVAKVGGTVALSAELRTKVAPEDTVVIFARPAEGPRMPLALLRVQAKDLPKSFSLDDSMAVAPEFKLSNFKEVVIGARVSKSGGMMPQKGDLEGVSERVRLGGQVKVTIDRVLP